jgi:hypothetical protein
VDPTVVAAIIVLIDLSRPSLASNDAIRMTLEDFRATHTPHHAVRLPMSFSGTWPRRGSTSWASWRGRAPRRTRDHGRLFLRIERMNADHDTP